MVQRGPLWDVPGAQLGPRLHGWDRHLYLGDGDEGAKGPKLSGPPGVDRWGADCSCLPAQPPNSLQPHVGGACRGRPLGLCWPWIHTLIFARG